MKKETVYLKKGYDYSPLHPKADPLTGMLSLWYAYNEQGVAVEWAPTKKEVIASARMFGYKVSTKSWDEKNR